MAFYLELDPVTGKFINGPADERYRGVKSINGQAPDVDGAIELELGAADWAGISGKPPTFPPSSHRHDATEIDNLPTGGGSVLTQVGTLTLPGSPAVGESVTVLADPSTVFPAATWDEGGVPELASGRLLVSLVWSGDDWVGTYGLPVAAAPAAPDVTAPTPGTLAASAITHTGFTLAVSGASDETALHASPYRFSTDNGVSYSAWQAGASFPVSGLTAETAYDCQHQVRDAAGNAATGVAIQVTTDEAPEGIDVAAIPDLIGWYDATDAGTLTLDGASVTQWADKSTVGGHATRSADGGATMSTLGELPAVQFGLFKPLTHTWDSGRGVAPCSLFVVARMTAVEQFRYIVSAGRARVGTGGDQSGNPKLFRSMHGGVTIDAATLDMVPHVLSTWTAGAQFAHAVDGVTLGDPAAHDTGGGRDGNKLDIGDYAQCAIGEVIIVSRDVPEVERDQIHAYLKAKWGIA